jgi:hypothetical protein
MRYTYTPLCSVKLPPLHHFSYLTRESLFPKVAMRLGHKHMELMLLNRVNEVIEKEKKKQPVDMDENGMIDSTSDW